MNTAWTLYQREGEIYETVDSVFSLNNIQTFRCLLQIFVTEKRWKEERSTKWTGGTVTTLSYLYWHFTAETVALGCVESLEEKWT